MRPISPAAMRPQTDRRPARVRAVLAGLTLVAAAFGGLAPATAAPAAPAAKRTTIIMDQMVFKPRHLTVVQGTVVRWWNVDRTLMQHNVVADDRSFDSGRLLHDREDYVWTADKLGQHRYTCTIHAGMDADITVVPAGKAAAPASAHH